MLYISDWAIKDLPLAYLNICHTQVQTWFAMSQTCVKPRSDQGLTRVRPGPDPMTASLNKDVEKQLYHDLIQGREDIEDVTNDPYTDSRSKTW